MGPFKHRGERKGCMRLRWARQRDPKGNQLCLHLHLVLDCQPLELRDDQFLLFNSSSPWNFVVVHTWCSWWHATVTLQMMKLRLGRSASEELGSWGEHWDSRVHCLPLFSPHIKITAKDHPHRGAKLKPEAERWRHHCIDQYRLMTQIHLQLTVLCFSGWEGQWRQWPVNKPFCGLHVNPGTRMNVASYEFKLLITSINQLRWLWL